jgi:nitroreductase
MDVIEAIKSRFSTRAFLDEPVNQETVTAILDAARWAPSGGNLQPWQVAVVIGETKRRIGDEIIQARKVGIKEHPDYPYYPLDWFEPYTSRRKATGVALYQSLGIEREDMEQRTEAWNRNYRFFDAPVGLLFFINRNLGNGAWVDLGLFLQNLMLTACDHGLATCPQASLADYPDIIRNILNIDDENTLICGLSLGYADPNAPVNQYRTDRVDISEFTQWYS